MAAHGEPHKILRVRSTAADSKIVHLNQNVTRVAARALAVVLSTKLQRNFFLTYRQLTAVVPVPGPEGPSIIDAASWLMSKWAISVAQSGQLVETMTMADDDIPVTW